MFIDASAIVAILAREEEGPALSARIDTADRTYTSPIAVYEAALGIARSRDASPHLARSLVENFLSQLGTEIIPITAEIGWSAIAAFERFGRGRHAARLNMGDCFAYACARSLAAPLLFKGDDFSLTDIERA